MNFPHLNFKKKFIETIGSSLDGSFYTNDQLLNFRDDAVNSAAFSFNQNDPSNCFSSDMMMLQETGLILPNEITFFSTNSGPYETEDLVGMLCKDWGNSIYIAYCIKKYGERKFSIPAVTLEMQKKPIESGSFKSIIFGRKYLESIGKHEAQKFMQYLHAISIDVLARVTSLSLCDNIYTETINPYKSNKKSNQDKKKLYEYKVLKIKRCQNITKSKNDEQTRPSPRAHLRRGHIRRLPSGKLTLIPACFVVGQGGFVDKEYSA